MKKALLTVLCIFSLLISLASCDIFSKYSCEHRDEDDLLCDNCGEDYDDGKDSTDGIVYTLSYHEDYYLVTGYTGTEINVKIPAMYNGKPVMVISDGAFKWRTDIRSITIPGSITDIVHGAFYGCYRLAEVINKSSLGITKGSEDFGGVGQYALEVHSGESKIDNVDGYLFYTYDGVNHLLGHIGDDKDLLLPESYNGVGYEIYKYAFCGREDVESVVIPDSVASIGNYAFSDCTGLASVTIGNGITVIGDHAFESCTALADIIIPNGVKSIGYYAFSGCDALNDITIPNSVTVIKSYAFSCCIGLKSLTIPESVTSTGTYTFEGCISLESVTIKDGVNSIAAHAFSNCTALESVVIPDSVTSIGERAFEECTNLTGVTIPDGVTSIGSSAFEECTGLTSITIPDSVTSIGERAFSNCTGLEEIYFNAKNMADLSNYNYVFSYAGMNGDGIKVIIDKNITKIPAYLFDSFSNKITSVEFEEGSVCESIGDYAFSGCTNLASITIPDSVTSIGDSAFRYCTGLTSITILDSVTSIGSSAFEDCSGLEEIYFNAANMADLSFDNCVFNNAGANGDGIKVIIGKNVAKIPAYLFCPYYSGYAPKITIVEFEEGSVCESIGEGTFSNCRGLTSVTIPDSVESIGNYAFSNCTGLEEIYFNAANMADLSYINYVFYNAGANGDGIKVIIGKNVTKIPEYLFCPAYGSFAPKITIVEFEEGSVCESIGDCAFYECTALTSVTIGNGVKSIGYLAFNACTNLTDVYYTGSRSEWVVISKGSSAIPANVTIHYDYVPA